MAKGNRGDFITASMALGYTERQSERRYASLRTEGYDPGRWHASRVDSLRGARYLEVRSDSSRKGSVSLEVAKQELANASRSLGTWHAQRRNAEDSRIIRTLEEYEDILDGDDDEELVDDEWASSVNY